VDRFTLIVGLIGFILIIISLYLLISTIIRVIKKKEPFRNSLSTFISFVIIFLISVILLLLFSFLQTFSKFSYEDKIGELSTEKVDSEIHLVFNDIKNGKNYEFNLNGDQWEIQGEILIFDKTLRWLGAESYFRVSRFVGRFEEPKEEFTNIYEINKKSDFWEFILKNGEKLPFIDTAYGIGAYQYPDGDFEIYVNDTGFILRKKKIK